MCYALRVIQVLNILAAVQTLPELSAYNSFQNRTDEQTNSSLTNERSPNNSLGFFSQLLNSIRSLNLERIDKRFSPECMAGSDCRFFAFCWFSGGTFGDSCGNLHTCCVVAITPTIQNKLLAPVVNDPHCGRSDAGISRIVGGNDASFGQFPWTIGSSRCGGALVGPTHVVTAGHCVARSQYNPSSIRVTLGDYILNAEIESLPHEVFTVSEVRIHPKFRFTPQADRYDVAVLVLDRPVHYRDNIRPICLPQKDVRLLGRMAFVVGWGALQAGWDYLLIYILN